MKSVYKFNIGLATTHLIPKGALFLSVQIQGEEICMWFEVDIRAETEPRKFHIVGTGHKFYSGKYLGTVQDGAFVWHVYEDLEKFCPTEKEQSDG